MNLMVLGTVLAAFNVVEVSYHHATLGIITILFLIFAQAFVMFYFIGVAKLVDNVADCLNSKSNLQELFESEVPQNLEPYQIKVNRFIYQSHLAKRQTIPWSGLTLVLGIIGFLLGGAHDTGSVTKTVHSGVVYGFIGAMLIGFFKQWKYLGNNHKLLRELKTVFGLSHNQM